MVNKHTDKRGLTKINKEKKKEEKKYTCHDCKYAYQPHEKGADGNYFLVKCKLYNITKDERYRWSKFVDQEACISFEKTNIKLNLNSKLNF